MCGQGYLEVQESMGRSKVILSRDDLFSVKARHRHLEWREFFSFIPLDLGVSFFWFLVQRPCILSVFS